MPLGDRTGPSGAGPMTGRGAGTCAGYNTPGYITGGGGFGRGMGRGMGMGRGFGRGFGFPAPIPAQTPVTPVAQANQADTINALKTQMDLIQQQIEALENQ